MIWKRDQYIAHMNNEFTGSEMFCELFGPLYQLEAEWRGQGASEDEIAMTAFDWDYVLKTGLPVYTGAVTDIRPRVIEENDEFNISLDMYGRKTKLFKNCATIALPLTHPVGCMNDWLKVKHWYEYNDKRINTEALIYTAALREKGYLVCANIPGGFDETRQLMGEAELCCAYYDEPEMINEILTTIADTCVKCFEHALKYCKIDCLCIHEDLAGKSGSLIGPNIINSFLKPYYRKVWDLVSSFGCTMFSKDSDGNINSVIDSFLDCGVTTFYPFEPMAGMDMVKIKQKYGRTFSIKGGIDKIALLGGREAIRRELEYKISDVTLGGGTVFGLDHRIPNGVLIDDYRYYVNLGREILGKPPITAKGWERMAF